MGVPGFFGSLMRKYGKNGFIEEEISDEIETLYFDWNSLIHPVCLEEATIHRNEKDLSVLHEKQFKAIVKYTKGVIDFVKPKKVYIAIDGVAPKAKINQQRTRRFKSAADNNFMKNLRKKYKKKSDVNPLWNSACITPSTEFLYDLSEYTIKCIKSGYFDPTGKMKIYFSSYKHKGEGEHKIYAHIKKTLNKINKNKEKSNDKSDSKKNKNSKNSDDDKSEKNKKSENSSGKKKVFAVYGLDADLIFLSLAQEDAAKIYLVREKSEFEPKKQQLKKNPKLVYVNIDTIKNIISQYMNNNQPIKKEKYINMFVMDFIFICKFLGNDFLPHFPSINVRQNSLFVLVETYHKMRIKYGEFLIEKTDKKIIINQKLLKYFLKKLSKIEFNEIQRINRSIFFQKKNKSEKMPPDAYEKELHCWKNLIQTNNSKFHDPIRFNQSGWKYRYYETYFGKKYNRNKISEAYLEGLTWSINYYFFECPSWSWMYEYNHAPLISDLYNYLQLNKKKYDINKIKFEKSDAISPMIQLLAVLPPSGFHFLPKSYQQKLSKDKYKNLYPETFSEDYLNKEANWLCIPHLPPLNIELLQNDFADCKLDKGEKERNTMEDTVFVKKAKK